jgi:hypothetical protein
MKKGCTHIEREEDLSYCCLSPPQIKLQAHLRQQPMEARGTTSSLEELDLRIRKWRTQTLHEVNNWAKLRSHRGCVWYGPFSLTRALWLQRHVFDLFLLFPIQASQMQKSLSLLSPRKRSRVSFRRSQVRPVLVRARGEDKSTSLSPTVPFTTPPPRPLVVVSSEIHASALRHRPHE